MSLKRSRPTAVVSWGAALILSLAMLSPAVAAAQRAGTTPRISAADAEARLRIIADDSMMGREAGRWGNYLATSYIESEVRRLGLEPAGDSGGYFQEIPLRQRVLDPTTTMAVGGSTLELWRDWAPVHPLGSLPLATSVELSDRPVLYGGRLGTTDALDSAATAGAVVVLDALRDSTGAARFDFGAVVGAMRHYPTAGALVITGLEQLPAEVMQFLRQPGTSLGEPPEQASTGMGLVFATQSVAEVIVGRGGSLDDVAVGDSAPSIAGGYRYVVTPPEAPARNVIAVLPGSDPLLRNQYVLISAHNDHIGMGRPVDHDSLRIYNTLVRPWGASTRNPVPPTAEQWTEIRTTLDSVRRLRPPRLDSIYNGADDDGSGTVAVLEIAEAFAAVPAAERPRRSVIFMWHTAEEKGLYGSQYFTDHPTVPRDSIVAALNMDMVGRGQPRDPAAGPRILQIIGSRRISTELGDLIEEVNAAPGHGFSFDYSFDAPGHPQQRYCRSDHYMYARYGIPISYFSAGYHQDYHQLTDEVQYINYPHLAAIASLLHDVVAAVANRDTRPAIDHEIPALSEGCRQ